MNNTENNYDIFRQCIVYVDEPFYQIRKGKPETFFVGIINKESEYWDEKCNDFVPVPEHMVGYWKTEHATDNSYISFDEAVREEEWVMCQRVVVETYEWVERCVQ